MGAPLPELSEEIFAARLRAALAAPIAPSISATLFLHYRELRRWNPRLSLVGPGTVDQVVERHYAESLRALPLLPRLGGRLVDIGSGAGFPGLAIAAARPDLQVTLVESRQRKWSFLLSAVRRASLSCRCLNARVGPLLPEGFPFEIDVVTLRAVRVSDAILGCLRPALGPHGSVLVWVGEEAVGEFPGWVERRSVDAGGDARRVMELRPS